MALCPKVAYNSSPGAHVNILMRRWQESFWANNLDGSSSNTNQMKALKNYELKNEK